MPKYAWIIDNRVNGFIDADESYIGMCGGEWVELDYEIRTKVRIGFIFNSITNEFIDDGCRENSPDNSASNQGSS